MKRKTTSRKVPKAQLGRAVKKVGNQIEETENKAKSAVKSAVKTAGSTAKKADDWMEENLRLLTKSPQYQASKYLLKKVLKKKGGPVKSK